MMEIHEYNLRSIDFGLLKTGHIFIYKNTIYLILNNDEVISSSGIKLRRNSFLHKEVVYIDKIEEDIEEPVFHTSTFTSTFVGIYNNASLLNY